MLNEFAKQKGLDESLGRDETSCVRLFTNNVLSQATVNFIVNFHS